jgi:D-alanine-D-alanine ligase
MSALRVLHLVGSARDDFYGDLSRLYARDCIAATADPARYDVRIAYVTPDGLWRFPASLSSEDIGVAEPVPLFKAIEFLSDRNIDVVLPQMFCLPGMTDYRALLDVMKIPYVGNPPAVMALAAHKARAKAVVAAAGINVPRGELLRPGDVATIASPVVIKPASADNSFGVSLVKDIADYDEALKLAFTYSSEVLVEEYIELGREVRGGTLMHGDKLIGLPLEEYRVDRETSPIRQHADKLKRTEEGDLVLTAKDGKSAWIVDPDDPITARVQAVAMQCHRALGCRHYGLFDFRIDPQGQIWFLEAGLYCSFSPKSVIVSMAGAAGITLSDLLGSLLCGSNFE